MTESDTGKRRSRMFSRLERRIQQGQLLPYRMTHLGGVFNTLFFVHVRRRLLNRALLRADPTVNDVTVVIPHRNRADYRLSNALNAIGRQAYTLGRIRVLVVDFGSSLEQRAELKGIASRFGIDLLLLDSNGPWNKARCLNIGLRAVSTKFVMLTDVDILLSTNYLQNAVRTLLDDPLRFAVTQCRWLPPECTEGLKSAASSGIPVDTGALYAKGKVLTDGPFSYGIVLLRTDVAYALRGFDEYYEGYGAEDVDFVQRLTWLGLRPAVLSGTDYYLHQWHPRHEGVRSDDLQARIDANHKYLRRMKSIKRNTAVWGTLRRANLRSVAPRLDN